MFELTNEQLGDEIQRLAAHIDAAICEWLGMVAEFDRREVWVEWGIPPVNSSKGDLIAFGSIHQPLSP